MTDRFRLPLRFDADELCRDLDQIDPREWIPHYNTADYEGDWAGVPLRSVGGRAGHMHADPAPEEPYADTPVLDRCPHLGAALASLGDELLSVRLLRLGPGASIREHTDVGLGYAHGEVRLHVPLTTSGDVEFRLNGETVVMRPGEVWYLDVSQPHAVANRSDETRVHLVVDARVGPWLEGLLGPVIRVAAPLAPAAPASSSAAFGIPLLEQLRASLVPAGTTPTPLTPATFKHAQAVLDTLGLGLEETCTYLFRAAPDTAAFERWISDCHGGTVDPDLIAAGRRIAAGVSPAVAGAPPEVLSQDELSRFGEDGVIVVPAAAPASACAELTAAIWAQVGADPERPETWHTGTLSASIMVQLYRAPGIAEIHTAPRIRGSFAQLLGTTDLVMSTDRCGFNPPVAPHAPYQGGGLHLDLESLEPPVSLGLQGLLYLTDTGPEDGAFRAVHGFHHHIDDWLRTRPTGRPVLADELEVMGARPVPGRAGDLVIWHRALPHGPSPNLGARPRIVHYLTMYPRPVPPDRAP